MNIIIHTEANPEDNAMLQALYSRSAASVNDHLQKLAQTGSGKFMSSYYLGYGHGSIGDCGFVTIYFEGVSMLAAKAIEDTPLFNGQECSSRYIDFSSQPFYNPSRTEQYDDPLIAELYSEYRSFYTESLQPVKDALKKRFHKPEGESDIRYEKAIAARTFDILRGFLPASATTNVAWTTSLRKAQDHLISLAHHPLLEVRVLALKTLKELHVRYPNSFKPEYAACEDFSTTGIETFLKGIEGEEMFRYASELEHFYARFEFQAKDFNDNLICDPKYIRTTVLDCVNTQTNSLIKNRPKRASLPRHNFETHRDMHMSTVLDFGSYRDLQRHRNGYCSNPILSDIYGLHPWYYEQLPFEVRVRAQKLLKLVTKVYRTVVSKSPDFETQPERARTLGQYLLPMGMAVYVYLKYSLTQSVYVAELRSGKTVHATLRPFAQELGKALKARGVECYYDEDPSDWTLKRGDQDIVHKSQ